MHAFCLSSRSLRAHSSGDGGLFSRGLQSRAEASASVVPGCAHVPSVAGTPRGRSDALRAAEKRSDGLRRRYGGVSDLRVRQGFARKLCT